MDYAPPESAGELSLAMHQLLKSIGEGPFMTRTVGEMLFDGWELDGYIEIIQMLSEMLGVQLPPVNIFFFFFMIYILLSGTNDSNTIIIQSSLKTHASDIITE